DAAAICGCAVGTIKSRVNRARTRLADLLSIDSVDDFGPDHATRAVLAGGGAFASLKLTTHGAGLDCAIGSPRLLTVTRYMPGLRIASAWWRFFRSVIEV